MTAIPPSVVQAARAQLGWSQVDLAVAAGIPVSQVQKAETAGILASDSDSFSKIRGAFDLAGVTGESVCGLDEAPPAEGSPVVGERISNTAA